MPWHRLSVGVGCSYSSFPETSGSVGTTSWWTATCVWESNFTLLIICWVMNTWYNFSLAETRVEALGKQLHCGWDSLLKEITGRCYFLRQKCYKIYFTRKPKLKSTNLTQVEVSSLTIRQNRGMRDFSHCLKCQCNKLFHAILRVNFAQLSSSQLRAHFTQHSSSERIECPFIQNRVSFSITQSSELLHWTSSFHFRSVLSCPIVILVYWFGLGTFKTSLTLFNRVRDYTLSALLMKSGLLFSSNLDK